VRRRECPQHISTMFFANLARFFTVGGDIQGRSRLKILVSFLFLVLKKICNMINTKVLRGSLPSADCRLERGSKVAHAQRGQWKIQISFVGCYSFPGFRYRFVVEGCSWNTVLSLNEGLINSKALSNIDFLFFFNHKSILLIERKKNLDVCRLTIKQTESYRFFRIIIVPSTVLNPFYVYSDI
jgi:hypothetical protein